MTEKISKDWTAHIGEDYAVVMGPEETTETASIRIHGSPSLAQVIADLLNFDTGKEIAKIHERFYQINKTLGDGPREDWMRPLEEEFAFLRGRLSVLESGNRPTASVKTLRAGAEALAKRNGVSNSKPFLGIAKTVLDAVVSVTINDAVVSVTINDMPPCTSSKTPLIRMEASVADTILRPSKLIDGKPWELALRNHDSSGETEYRTIAHITDKTALALVDAGAPFFLFGDPRESAPDASDSTCDVCSGPMLPDDTCATDIEMGICHAACLAGSATVDLKTGEQVEGPMPTYRYGDLDTPNSNGGEKP